MLIGLLGGLLTTNTGCGLFQAVFCWRPSQTRYDSGYGNCDDGACGPTCGPTCRRGAMCARRAYAVSECDSCGGDCGPSGCGRVVGRSSGSCEDPCGDPCGSGCYARCWHRGPLSCVFALLAPSTWCGAPCGERYWGDFYSDPPDCSDPCDGYGNYAGGGIRSYASGNGMVRSSGCKHCNGGGGTTQYSGDMDEGEVVNDRIQPSPSPVPAQRSSSGQPHKAARPQPQPQQ
jgi:hypothetical protein